MTLLIVLMLWPLAALILGIAVGKIIKFGAGS